MTEPRFCPLCASPLAPAERDAKTRLACTAPGCDYVHWDNPVPVVAAILEVDGQVLLARNKAWPPKTFGLVAGYLEPREDPAKAVLREVAEETGLTGEVVGLVGAYGFERMNQLILAYHVRASGEIRLSDELAEVKLLPPEKVRAWPFGTGVALAEWLAKRVTVQ